MRVCVGDRRRSSKVLAGFAALACTLLAATCWRWSGVEARTLSLEQAVDAMHHREAVPVVFGRICEMIDDLERAATQPGETGESARHALAKLRERFAR